MPTRKKKSTAKRKGWENPPTPGYVAWLLWGGDAARTRVKKVLRYLDAE